MTDSASSVPSSRKQPYPRNPQARRGGRTGGGDSRVGGSSNDARPTTTPRTVPSQGGWAARLSNLHSTTPAAPAAHAALQQQRVPSPAGPRSRASRSPTPPGPHVPLHGFNTGEVAAHLAKVYQAELARAQDPADLLARVLRLESLWGRALSRGKKVAAPKFDFLAEVSRAAAEA